MSDIVERARERLAWKAQNRARGLEGAVLGDDLQLAKYVPALLDDLERATRLIRTLCNRAPESPGCLYPACDCGMRSPGGEPV